MGFLGNGLHVLLVENLEGLGITQAEDLLAEELDAEGVNGADEVTGMLSADETVDTAAHLLCCLVGKGQT